MADNPEVSYIPDGYTVSGYIAGIPRMFPPARMTYRPATSQQRAVYFTKIERERDASKCEVIAAEAIRRHVVSWDLKKPDKKDVELKTPEILRVTPGLFQMIYQVITGSISCDVDPDDPDDIEPSMDVSTDLDAALNDASMETEAVKN